MIKLCDEAEELYKRAKKALRGKQFWLDVVRGDACQTIGKKIKFNCKFDGDCYRSPLKEEEKKNDKKSKDV